MKRAILSALMGLSWCALPGPALMAQEPPLLPSAPSSRPAEALRIFLDCQGFYCDLDFFRTEITFVNWVRDRRDAEVHIFGTVRQTAAGGREFTLQFIGQKSFVGNDARLLLVSLPNESEDAIRQGLSRIIKLGLFRYVADTPLADSLQILYKPLTEGQEQTPAPPSDRWSYWVFRTSINGSFSSERSSRSANVFGSFGANRTTEDWKVNIAVNGGYNRSEFTLSDESIFTSLNKRFGVNGLMVRSIGGHWAIGAKASASHVTFVNQDLNLRVAPGIELNAFPYSESTRRQLTFQYTVGLDRFRYIEETIFLKTTERLWDQTLLVSLDVKQPWGSAGLSFEAAHYLEDMSKNHMLVFGDVDVALFKGFSLNLNAFASRIRDQLYLPREEATTEEILVRQRQLATSYRFSASFGIRYTFGSIYNNVVNPRFEGSTGGVF